MSSNHKVCMKQSTLEHRQVLSRKTSIQARSLHLGLPLRQCGSLSPKPESAHLPLVIETLTLSQIPDSAFKPSYPSARQGRSFDGRDVSQRDCGRGDVCAKSGPRPQRRLASASTLSLSPGLGLRHESRTWAVISNCNTELRWGNQGDLRGHEAIVSALEYYALTT